MSRAYERDCVRAGQRLVELVERANRVTWEAVIATHEEVERLISRYSISKEIVYQDMAVHHRWAAMTIKKSHLTVRRVKAWGLIDMMTTGQTSWGVVIAIVNSKLDDERRRRLLEEVFEHDRAKKPYTCQQVSEMLRGHTKQVYRLESADPQKPTHEPFADADEAFASLEAWMIKAAGLLEARDLEDAARMLRGLARSPDAAAA